MTDDRGSERRPRIILITGSPGSGKTTLGAELSRVLQIPFLARDDVRRGLFLTAGGWGDRPERVPSADEAVEVFLRVLEATTSLGVSCIVEYVLRRGEPAELERITAAGDCVAIVTNCERALERFERRHRHDPLFERQPVLDALGFATVDDHTADALERMREVTARMRTDFDIPTLLVDTGAGYHPSFERVLEFAIGDA